MRNMNEFTDRVTLCEDGIYRWYYDLDLKENPGFMGRAVRIVGIICAALCVLTLAMFSTDRSRFNMETAMAILAAYAGCFVLTWGCCRLAASMRRISRIYYEMNDDALTIVRTPQQAFTATLMTKARPRRFHIRPFRPSFAFSGRRAARWSHTSA